MIEIIIPLATFAAGTIIASCFLGITSGGKVEQARALAERWKGHAESRKLERKHLEDANAGLDHANAVLTNNLRRMQDDIDALTIERNTARAELHARVARASLAVSRGNRTRRIRKNGGLLPPPVNDITDLRQVERSAS